MAYNLPPSWDPGFAMPDNALDEGLERRAFVTKQIPRGTYDQPRVGTGGYAVPRYVMDEGYGQGTFTTKWQPSGTYNGPRVPAWLNRRPEVVRSRALPGGGREVTVQPLGDAPLPEPFQSYGARAAQVILRKVLALPPGERNAALRKVMDAVDRSLWSRTQDIWKRYLREGMPPGQALPLAISRAMSAGIAAEIINAGLRRSAPQARSLLGLGCYGRTAALGAIGDDASATCAPPAGFTWVPASGTVSGHWERLRAGATPNPGPCGPGGVPVAVDVRQHDDVNPGGGVTREPIQRMKLGPFLLPLGVFRYWQKNSTDPARASLNAKPDLVITRPEDVPDEWAGFIRKQLTENPTLTGNLAHKAKGFRGGDRPFGKWVEHDVTPWFARFGISNDDMLNVNKRTDLRNAINPLLRTKHPVTGEDLAIYVVLGTRKNGQPPTPYEGADPSSEAYNPLELKVWLSLIGDPSWWAKIQNGLSMVISTVANVVYETVSELGELACDLISTPGVGAAAGAAGGMAAGLPPQAGAAAGQSGAQIAQGACGAPPPPQPPPPPPPPPGISGKTLAILGAMGAVAIVLLSGRRDDS